MRRVPLSIAVCLLGTAAIACGTEADVAGSRTLAVQPRVVVDGMVELGAVASSVADTRLIVDEVLFHAPAVSVRQNGEVVSDLLADEDALLFRYEAASSDGFGDVIGGERRWNISDADADGNLVVGFAPLGITDTLLGSGVDLSGLAGHTATVHGYMLMSAPDAAGLGTECEGAVTEGDPDGNPAACEQDSGGVDSEGDPDGNPSEGDPDGNPAEGDPDGNPAKSSDEGDEAEGNPDGNPADGDPDGNPSEGPEADGERQGQVAERTVGDSVRVSDGRVARERVPFLLVLNRSFSLRVPVAGLFEDRLAQDEVRPLELHVRLDELLSHEVLEFLAKKAADTTRGQIVLEVPDAQVGLDVNNQGVERRVRADVSSAGIRVVDRH